MPELGSLWYSVGLKDLTDADIKKINDKLKNLGSDLFLNPQFAKPVKEILPQGLKLELDPKLNAVSNEALAKAVEGKVMKVEIAPLLTNLRKALKDGTKDNPPEVEVGVQSAKLRTLIQDVLNKHGFLINITTVNDNYTKVVQQKLNGTRYTVKIHADAKEITRSVQASLMQVQSRTFGLQVTKDVLRRSIDEALMGKPFPIQIAVQHDQARKAVQDALLRAQVIGKDQALAYQRLQTGELKAAQAELARLKAAHMGAADAAKAHATASINLGGALGSNIKIAGELSSAMASLYSVHAAKEFLAQVIEIGGELEHQKIAMDTIFGDKGKTSELFGQIKGLARQSPFGIMELTKSVKALSAYGVQYNEIYDTAKRLADISAATSVDINRLILAFGKTKSRGFLDGLEAKQFAYANIPIYEMVRRKLEELEGQAVTTAQVMERMKKREIGFDIVKDVLWDMTDEGGKFYNMQEALAGSVKTSWKLVRDNIELMFGEIAESSVGGVLKDVAETLQVLTRNWRAMGTMIGAAAVAFGVYKVAVAASNQMMGLSNAATLKSVTATNLAKTAKLSEAATYRELTNAEKEQFILKSALAKLNRSLLLTHKALTEAEWEAAFVNGKVTEEYILRRIALGKLTKAEIDYIVTSGMVDAQLVKTAVAASKTKISLASLYAMVKAGAASTWASTLNFLTRIKTGIVGVGVSMQKLNFASFTASIRNAFANALIWVKTLPTRIANVGVSVTRLKLALSGLGRAMSSIGAFLLNPATLTMAAIGGLMYAWEKNNEQMEKAKEIGDNLFTKATEGANNLSQALGDIKPSSGLSNHDLTQGIEKMEQAIKDYSPRPLEDINDSLVSQDGHVLTLAERYDVLKKKLEEIKDVYDLIGDVEKGDLGRMVTDSINSTGGFLNDNVIENAKDYSKALKTQADGIRAISAEHRRDMVKAVEAAAKVDASYREAIKNMTTMEQKFKELFAMSANGDFKYQTGFNKAKNNTSNSLGIIANQEDIRSAYATFEADVQKQIRDISANIQMTWGTEIGKLSDTQKDALAVSLKNMIDQAEGISEDVKARWAQMLEEAFSITILEDKIGPALKGSLTSLANEATDAQIIAVVDKWRNEGWAALSEAEQQIVWNMMQDAKTKTMELLGITQQEMQDYLLEHPLIQTIELAYTTLKATDYQKAIWESSPNLAKLLNEAVPTPLSGAGSLTEKAKKQRAWYNEWTRGSSGDYETKNKIKSDLEALHNEILASKNRSAEYRKMKQDEFDAKMELAEAMGFTDIELRALKSNKHSKGSQKDTLAESLKQRFKDIKDAWSEFQKWSKTNGREAAATRIGESGLFSTLSADKIPQTVEQYRALVVELEKELRQAGVKGTARESLLNDLLKQLLDIDKTVVDEQLKLALDKVSKEAERQLADWNLFDKIRKATGNQDLAMSIAFGMNATAETDYPAMIKQQLQKTVEAAESALSKAIPKEGESPYKVQGYTYDKLKELYDARDTDKGMQEWVAVPEDIRKAWEKANGDILKYFDQQRESVANILNEYQTLQDKISAINAKRNLALETINAKNERGEYLLSDEERAKRSSVVNTQADYDIFTQSNDYLRFFNDIYGLTMDEANRIGDLIQLNLNRKLQDGLITIYDYEQQMEKVRKQLEALRNVKSDAMTFLTGGLKGLNQKKLQKAEGELANNTDYQKALKEQIAAQNALNKAQEEGNEEAIEAAEAQLALANQSVKVFTKIRDAIIADQEKMQNILDVTNIAANIAGGMSDAFNTLRDMADSFGFDTESNAWETAAAVMDTLTTVTGGVQKVIQSAMSGDIGGIIGGAFDTLLTPFTIWSKLHDKKLQKMIERSKEAAQIMQNQYDILEKRMANFLGNAANMKVEGYSGEGGAYGKQRELMQGQLAELEKQRQAEIDKKKTDDSVVADYDKQIEEMKIAIQDFAVEAAKDLYGIDLKGWASELGDALFEAWKKGEDGAEAFKRKAGEILGNVMNEVLKLGLLEPMMEDVQKFLFGEDGKSGAFGSDFELTPDELEQLAGKLMAGMEGVDAYNSALDQLEKILNEKYGLSMKGDEESKSGLSAGIQGVTEDTADLLASYLNAIRADVAMQTGSYWTRLLDDSLPQMNVIAQSQLDTQRQIAENTLRNAVAAEAIQVSTAKLVELNDQMGRSWRRIAERNWGSS